MLVWNEFPIALMLTTRDAKTLPIDASELTQLGLPVDAVRFDVPSAISKEVRVETVFRYANVFDRSLGLIASGKADFSAYRGRIE